MKKQSLFLVPFLLLLACKKNETPAPVPPTADPTVKVDMKDPFKGLIFANYKQTMDFKMIDADNISYPGFITDINSIKDKTFIPFLNVQVNNNEFALKDINDVVFAKATIKDHFALSKFRDEFNTLTLNVKKVVSPKISYELYASEDIEHATKTNLTLIIKAIYYYLELNPVKDEHLKLDAGLELNKVKESGAYLSKIGYGSTMIYTLNSDKSPKETLPYLKAYLNDQLNNKGTNAKDLKNKIVFDAPSKTFLGGDADILLNKYLGLPVAEAIESAFKDQFVPQTYRGLAQLEFKFKSLKDNKEIN
ncbi:hypothetical protein [Pedobacter caeni]|uniref:Uncharacterized protein n=1 Tax=Pedobacter caeni TaxID=288992 RepID=A0A1M5H5V0_9SPHI|nr:hypothetical protein [Pedobacter caeni]SHG11285.1 hypothetical protein SAMN04488522_104517 [Pedobacter caeni]